jgi:hypothetical protein
MLQTCSIPSIFVLYRCIAGGNFCAGYDLTSLANTETMPSFEEPLVNSKGPMVCTIQYLDCKRKLLKLYVVFNIAKLQWLAIS